MNARRFVTVVAWGAALTFLVTGAWAFLAPRSFFDVVATYPPYNVHLFHDLGAFQLGIGAALVAGLLGRGGLATGLWGAAAGTVVHALSHVMDADRGGRSSDPVLFGLLAAVIVAALVSAERRR
ncbi:MAG: hypothetical protein LC722_04880 [Actinobacteria bacterium]|nr:hypothetical protein [Actinomycetota bacterium]